MATTIAQQCLEAEVHASSPMVLSSDRLAAGMAVGVRIDGRNVMDLAGSLNKAIEIVKLNGTVAAEVGRDEQSLQPGLVFIAVSGLAAVSPRSSSTAASAG